MTEKEPITDPLALFLIATPDRDENTWNDDVAALNHVIESVKERYSIDQYGAKSGQTYFEHATNGIHSIVQLLPHASIPSPFDDGESMLLMKTLCLSYLIHDLNKMPWNPKEKELLWHKDIVLKELETINGLTDEKLVDAFFPAWREYINDITTFIKGHSRIFSERGDETLQDAMPVDRKCKLAEDDMTLGVDVMRLVDIIDLIRHPSMKEFVVKGMDEHGNDVEKIVSHDNLFKWINKLLSDVVGRRMKTSTVRVTKEASRFTNVLLNQAIVALANREIYPLRLFTTGMVVFGSKESFNDFYTEGEMDALKNEIGDLFADKIVEFLTRDDNMDTLYNVESQGIKFVEFVYQRPNASRKMRRVMEYLADHVQPVAHKPDDLDKSSRYNASTKLHEYIPESVENDPVFAEWERGENTALLENDTIWKLGRYVNTAFITVPYMYKTWKNENIDQVDLMKEMLELLGIFDRLKTVYNKPENISTVYRYYFSHVIGKALMDEGKTMDDIKEPLIQFLVDKLEACEIDEAFMENPVEFVDDHLQVFTTSASSADLVQATDPGNDIQCTACGKRLKKLKSKKDTENAYKWKSQFVPKGVPVEKFSNFLPAGMASKAVRMVCDSCKWRYYLDVILATVDGKKIDTWYCTFYPRDGLPYDAIKSIQQQVQRIKAHGEDAETSFRVVPENSHLNVETRKGYGFQLPSIPEEICGSITIDWKIKNNPVNEQFWEVLQQVLLIATRTGMRCVITKLRNDYEDLIGEEKDIIFQDVPQDFKQLLGGKDWLSFDDASIALSVMDKIDDVINQTVKKDHQKHKSEIVKRLTDPLSVIHYIEHYWDDDRKKKNTIARARYLDTVKDIVAMQQQVSRS